MTIKNIYTDGACFELYRILKTIFPHAEAYYDGSHVYTKIGNKFYDINGETGFTDMGERGLRKMTKDDKSNARFWVLNQFTKDKND